MKIENQENLNKIEKSIDGLYKDIEQLISISHNNILLLDYTYAIFEDSDLKEIQSFYFTRKQNYNEYIVNYINTYGNTVPLPKEGLKCVFQSSGSDTAPEIEKSFGKLYSAVDSDIDYSNREHLKLVSIENWHEYADASESKFGGFVMTTFYPVAENAMLGIYLVLSNRIDEKKDLKQIYEIRDIIKNYLLIEGWKLFYTVISDDDFKAVRKGDKIMQLLLEKEQRIQEKEQRILELEQEREESKIHRHTIRNFGFEDHLSNLEAYVSDIPPAIKIFKHLEKLTILRDIVIDFIYSHANEPIHRLLIYRQEIRTYYKILALITASTFNENQKFVADEQMIENHPCNLINDNDLVVVFNMLINLCSNTRKYSKGSPYEIIIQAKKAHLFIIFRNAGEMKSKYIHYLKTQEPPLDIVRGQGLQIIVESLEKLPNCSLDKIYSSKQKGTEIILKIRKNNENFNY